MIARSQPQRAVSLASIIEQTKGLNRTNNRSETQGIATNQPQEKFGLPAEGEIDEEKFQHVLVKYMLEDLNPEAAATYVANFKEARAQGVPVEDSVKLALKGLVGEGQLSQTDAEKINGVTFRAAQLDNNLEALYDGRGGPNDPTVAKASVGEAAARASAVFEAAEAGELTLSARSLDAQSNIAPTHSSSSVGGAAHAHGVGSGEFLWKPASESDGKLVVLLPSQYTGRVVSAGIYSSVPPTQRNKIEEGRFSGDTHNGGRAHFRFSKGGNSYPDGVYVVAKLSNGKTVSFPIKDSSARNTA